MKVTDLHEQVCVQTSFTESCWCRSSVVGTDEPSDPIMVLLNAMSRGLRKCV